MNTMSTRTRSTLIALALVLGAASVQAAQTLKVSSDALAGWILTGADLDAMSRFPSLALPSGAQLARSFQARGLGINLAARPVFGDAPEEWPVVQIGTNAIAFIRSGDRGALVLLIGTQSPIALPFSFALDEQGRMPDDLQLAFVVNDDTVGVSAQDQMATYPIGVAEGSAIEVALAAGRNYDLPVSSLEIVVLAPTADTDDPTARDGKGQASGAEASGPEATGKTQDEKGGASGAVASKVLTIAKVPEGTKAPAAAVFMEIISPGAHRPQSGPKKSVVTGEPAKARN